MVFLTKLFSIFFILTVLLYTRRSDGIQLFEHVNNIMETDSLKTLILCRNNKETALKDTSEELIRNVRYPILTYVNKKFTIKYLRIRKFLTIVFLKELFGDFIISDIYLSLQNTASNKIIFVCRKDKLERTLVQGLFLQIHKISMFESIVVNVNADGTVSSIYSFDPFPSVKAKEFFGNTTKDLFYDQDHFNCKGNTIGIGGYMNLFQSYKYVTNQGQVTLQGYVVTILKEFLKKHNCSIKINVHESPENEFSTALSTSLNHHVLSKVVGFRMNCIIVPHAEKIPFYKFVVISIQKEVWIAIIVTVLYISLLIFVMELLRKKNLDFGESLLGTISGLIFISPCRYMIMDGKKEDVFRFQMILYGFVLTNLYFAKMFSLWSKDVYESQIENWEDIKERKIQILYHVTFVKAIGDIFTPNSMAVFSGLTDSEHYLFKKTNTENWMQQLMSFNNKFGYSVDDDAFMDYILKYGTVSSEKYFHKTNICALSKFNQLGLLSEKYFNALNRYLSQIIESGLYDYWKMNSTRDLIARNIIKPIKDTRYVGPQVLNIMDFYYMWIFLGFGLTLSFACFVLELLTTFICRF